MCMLCSAAYMCVSASVPQEYSTRAGHRVPLNIHDIVRRCRLTQGEILCGYCKQIHCTAIGPLTHTHTHNCRHMEVLKNGVKRSRKGSIGLCVFVHLLPASHVFYAALETFYTALSFAPSVVF